jgi:threonine dehydratase
MTVLVETAGQAVVLTINRPEVHNAIDRRTARLIADSIRTAAADPGVRGIVLTGAGSETFTSGGDQKEFGSLIRDEQDSAREVLRMFEHLSACETCELPVIAAVQGSVIGGGCELILLCDLVIVEEHATLTFRHARMGLAPAWGGFTRLVEKVGPLEAARVLYTAEKLNAEDAHRIGLVNEVVPSGLARARAIERIHRIASNPRVTVARLKSTLREIREARRGDAPARERAAFIDAWGGAEHRQAVTRYLKASPRPLGPQDVRAAAERLHGKVIRTPVIRCPALDALAGAELWLKAENLQRIGAFKARGAMHAVGRLDAERRARGVITFSSGNHAQAVALAAKEYGVRADIAMPIDAPPIKLNAVKALGATVVLAGTTSLDRKRAAIEIQSRTGGTIIDPFDDPDIIAGQGTATLELLEQIAEATGGHPPDALIVPVGGGGLISGACLACSGTRVRIYSAEPVGCDAMAQSIHQGERVAVQPGPTLADGLRPVQIGELPFRIAREQLAGTFTVGDEELGSAVVRLLFLAKLLVEPSGAAGLAVALQKVLPGKPRRIGVILSGGNIDPAVLVRLIERHAIQP